MVHEAFERDEQIETSSDRSFGVVMAMACAVFGSVPLLYGSAPVWWLYGIGAVFLLLALAWPRVLAKPNQWWMRFGLFLGKIVNPVILGLMFFLVITPFALVMRWTGRDTMRRKQQPEASTYWQDRETCGPPSESMRNQF